MKKYTITLLIVVLAVFCGFTQTRIAGFRASRILSSYPNHQFPDASYWINTGQAMANKFQPADPAAIWIVSLYNDAGSTRLGFPNPGGTYPYLLFSSSDLNESYLTQLDTAGFKVWLQVEPGAASIDTMIYLVLNRYHNHSCVAGFGIDVEWLNAQAYSGGQHVTDSMAQHWEQRVKAVDTSYTLFLKHYSKSWMPQVYRGDIMFVDDSQDFPGLNSMVSEFQTWGTKFNPNKVCFQFGYKIDSLWWKQFSDPPQTIGDSLFSHIPNCHGVFWVDFTINMVFPVNTSEIPTTVTEIQQFDVYPNPLSSTAIIKYNVAEKSTVAIFIKDSGGKEILTLSSSEKLPGAYTAEFKTAGLKPGVYFVELKCGKNVSTKKMVIVD